MSTEYNKVRHIRMVILIAIAALLARAAQLQLFDRSYRIKADATTIEKLTLYPSRGLIFDRNGKLILNNEPMYDLMAVYNQVDHEGMDVDKFCKILGITRKEFDENLNKNWKDPRFSRSVPFVFLKKISSATYARLQESLYEFPGFFVQVRNIRGYPYNAGAHVLGYINEVDPRDIERGKGIYRSGDYIGAAGLELEYETYFRGKKGSVAYLKDHLGRIVGKYDALRDSAAVAGSDLICTLDIDLQAYGEHLLQNKTGSIVAIEPMTGEILAMVSAPYYNPNLLTMTQGRGQIFSQLLTDPLKPFFDRTVMAKYPPGSIFKTVVSLVGLQEGTAQPHAGKSCGGGYFYAGRLYKCHGHGGIGGVVDAIAYSCNTYYFQEFREIVDNWGFNKPEVGLAKFEEYAKQLGLGVKLGVDYPNESPGNIPGVTYYDKIYPKKLGGWKSPTIMSVGIGQGEVQMTTLQMANLAACIANRGYWYRPHLAKSFKDDTPIPQRFRQKQTVNIAREHFELVAAGMSECVKRGTARVAAIPDIEVCGKTGTSQNPHGDDHSVFFAFAPRHNPKIAIAVYVEHAGWGASFAAPIASLMIEKYLNKEIHPSRKALEERVVKANLIDKYLASINKTRPIYDPNAPRDTLPDPLKVPIENMSPGATMAPEQRR
ncbi:MAG: penicillin-binding protein 2 [Saprospiraceae bacterium]